MGEPQFIPYEEAKKIVAEMIEMEHPREEGSESSTFTITKVNPYVGLTLKRWK